MLTAVLVILGTVAAWLLADRLLLRRDERLHRGHASWSASMPDRVFHSTGWEETVPPLEVIEGHAKPRHGPAQDRVVA